MSPVSTRMAVTLALCLSVAACNRAALRIPGASPGFPAINSGYLATEPLAASIEVMPPVDARAAHYDDAVAGTRWKGCSTDALWSETAASFLQARLNQEIASAGLFLPPTNGTKHLILKSEIDAFCSQVVGVVFDRAAGIVSIKFSLVKDDKTLWERKIEHVVTDADPEYTGSQLTTIEQAMRTTMTDSLRVVFRELFQDIEKNRADLRAALER